METLPRSAFRLTAAPGATPLGAIFLAIGFVAAVAVGVLHLDRLPFTVCAFKAVTGLPCMTCGTTRTLGLLVAGDVQGAFRMSPLAAAAGVLLSAWGLADLWLLRRGAALRVETGPGLARAVRLILVAAVGANWAYLIAFGR